MSFNRSRGMLKMTRSLREATWYTSWITHSRTSLLISSGNFSNSNMLSIAISQSISSSNCTTKRYTHFTTKHVANTNMLIVNIFPPFKCSTNNMTSLLLLYSFMQLPRDCAFNKLLMHQSLKNMLKYKRKHQSMASEKKLDNMPHTLKEVWLMGLTADTASHHIVSYFV